MLGLKPVGGNSENIMKNIVVAGIGGVGGYFGGLLAKHYEKDAGVSVHFLARGKNLEAIRESGLKVLVRNSEFTVRPASVSNELSDMPEADLLLLCNKTFYLDEMMREIGQAITPRTIIVPLQNGVDSYDKLRAAFPDNMVAMACVYVVAGLKSPGLVENLGNIEKLIIGAERPDQSVQDISKLLIEAGIDTTVSEEIRSVLWEKFVFISPLATLTSYFNMHIGPLREDDAKLALLFCLIDEVCALAKASGVMLREGIEEITMEKIKKLPGENTTSMHRDFVRGGRTELESLTGYVVRSSKKLNLLSPYYEEFYQALKVH
jgi:2-dehydropantoate 2-reductase